VTGFGTNITDEDIAEATNDIAQPGMEGLLGAGSEEPLQLPPGEGAEENIEPEAEPVEAEAEEQRSVTDAVRATVRRLWTSTAPAPETRDAGLRALGAALASHADRRARKTQDDRRAVARGLRPLFQALWRRATRDAEFKEEEHPRNEGGEFTSGSSTNKPFFQTKNFQITESPRGYAVTEKGKQPGPLTSVLYNGDLIEAQRSIQRHQTKKEETLRKEKELEELKRRESKDSYVDGTQSPTTPRTFNGLRVEVETKAGETRSGPGFSVRLRNDYGYVPRTRWADGDELDCFLGPHESADYVYVIHTKNPETGVYDEDKCMLGFNDEAEALAAFRANYDDRDHFDGLTRVPLEEFRRSVGQATKDAEEGEKLIVPLAEGETLAVELEPAKEEKEEEE